MRKQLPIILLSRDYQELCPKYEWITLITRTFGTEKPPASAGGFTLLAANGLDKIKG